MTSCEYYICAIVAKFTLIMMGIGIGCVIAQMYGQPTQPTQPTFAMELDFSGHYKTLMDLLKILCFALGMGFLRAGLKAKSYWNERIFDTRTIGEFCGCMCIALIFL